MKFYEVPVYRVTINDLGFVNSSHCGMVVVSKKGIDKVKEPVSGEVIPIQKIKYCERGRLQINRKKIEERGFQFTVYEDDLVDKNVITKKTLISWIDEFGSTMFQYLQMQGTISSAKHKMMKKNLQ